MLNIDAARSAAVTLEHLDALIAFAVVLLGVSLLVTILTQMIATLLGLRGTNLRWGLTELLRAIHPEFAGQAEAIAERVLTHPLISDSTLSGIKARFPLLRRWQLASTIRIEELAGILDKLAAGAAALPPGTPPPNYTLEQAMATIAQGLKAQPTPELLAIAAHLRGPAEAAPMAAAAAAAAGGSSAPGAATPAVVNVTDVLNRLPAAAAKGSELRNWFDRVMDRASQRFALHTRIWTIVFSILVAFALHLDSFRLLSQLSSHAQLRASLAATADVLMKKAAEPGVLKPPPPAAGQAAAAADEVHVPQVYSVAMTELLARNPALSKAGTPPAFATREQAAEWLRGRKGADAIQPEYDRLLNSMIRTDMDKLLDSANSVKGMLAGTGFQLVPNPYHGWDFWPINVHFWGILVTAALLSLGAPFWFNTLRNLSSLRPLLAGKLEREASQTAGAAAPPKNRT